MREIIGAFREFTVLVAPVDMPSIVGDDPDDDMFLWCAVTAGAAFLVSRDGHLLKLRAYQGVRILSSAAFLVLVDAPSKDQP